MMNFSSQLLRKGAIVYGRRRQEKRRNGGPSYCQIQEKSCGFGDPSGSS